jgi:hypothetical protein
MGGWKRKFVFLLVVYFAGFATAIYTLAPVPKVASRTDEQTFGYSAFKSDEFAKSFNSGMHKCIDFSRDAALHVGRFIKQKANKSSAVN